MLLITLLGLFFTWGYVEGKCPKCFDVWCEGYESNIGGGYWDWQGKRVCYKCFWKYLNNKTSP